MEKFNWTPMNNCVVVECDKVEEKSAGGIIYTATSKEREQYGKDSGTLIAVGESAFEGLKVKPEVGDKVMYDKYDGKVRDNGEYRILVDEDILAIKKGKE